MLSIGFRLSVDLAMIHLIQFIQIYQLILYQQHGLIKKIGELSFPVVIPPPFVASTICWKRYKNLLKYWIVKMFYQEVVLKLVLKHLVDISSFLLVFLITWHRVDTSVREPRWLPSELSFLFPYFLSFYLQFTYLSLSTQYSFLWMSLLTPFKFLGHWHN